MNEIHYKSYVFVLIAIVYFAICITYFKHYGIHNHYDYYMQLFAYLLLIIFEYNISTKYGTIEMPTYEKLRLAVLFAIAGVYGKHLYNKQDYDYLLLGGLYLTYAAMLYGSNVFHNQFIKIIDEI